MSLKGKLILVTSGPTRVPIDKVRVLTNTATGETGKLLANALLKAGAKVTLLTGSECLCGVNRRTRVINFRFFDELDALLKKELGNTKFDIAIHAAAVSDYRPLKTVNSKIRSGGKNLSISLSPTRKLIKIFKARRPHLRLAAFKFEPDYAGKSLIKRGEEFLKLSRLDWVVANTNKNNRYSAYIINGKTQAKGPLRSKKQMVAALIRYLGE